MRLQLHLLHLQPCFVQLLGELRINVLASPRRARQIRGEGCYTGDHRSGKLTIRACNVALSLSVDSSALSSAALAPDIVTSPVRRFSLRTGVRGGFKVLVCSCVCVMIARAEASCSGVSVIPAKYMV